MLPETLQLATATSNGPLLLQETSALAAASFGLDDSILQSRWMTPPLGSHPQVHEEPLTSHG